LPNAEIGIVETNWVGQAPAVVAKRTLNKTGIRPPRFEVLNTTWTCQF
jgi:hypothetical protein